MKNKKSVAVICGLLLMGPAVLSQLQNEDAVTSVEAAEHENLLTNGDFSLGKDNWSTWDGEGGSSTFEVLDEQAKVTVHSIAGIHPEWDIPITWSTQLFQEGISLEGNQTYQVSFDAKSSMERPIVVEAAGVDGPPQSEVVLTENMQTFTFDFDTTQAGSMDLKFLIGNVHYDGLTTPEDEHELTFDNISVTSLGEITEDTSEPNWQMTWSDEFNGETLDLENWTIDIGNGFWAGDEWISGWGNNEKQYYHEDNVRVEDGVLILEAKEEQMSDEHGDYDYSSGKILTRDKFSQTYGRFEARMKLPEGQGYWPAFWMMPQDDTYGGWAASGEIDIMENQGSQTNEVGAAIHYGGVWPTNTYSHGVYTFDEGSTTEFNNYSVEWEPEEIRWYVNDELYYRTSEWHSENGHYPAPFNQDFFMIMNLAVGGWYGGEPDETTGFPAQVEVDYVRVYEDANANYDKSPTPKTDEEKEEEQKEEEAGDGLDRDPANWQAVGDNLITDGSFDDTTSFGDPDNLSTWNLFNLADHDPNGGKAEFSVVDNVLNAEIQQVGWNWWQIQLFQNLTLSEGTYKLSFDMSSEREREMRVRLEDSGEGIKVFSVNEEEETHEFIFHVQAEEEFKFLFGFGREHDEVELDVPYLMTLDNVMLTAAEPVEEAPVEETDPDNGETPVEGEEPEEDKEQDKEDKEQDKEEKKDDKEQDKADKEEMKDEEKTDKEDEKGEKLPETATGVWTVGALGLTGLTSGLGMKFFKRK